MTITTNYQLRFSSHNTDTSDTILDATVVWDNPVNDAVVADRINSWLTAIGADLEVVEKLK